LAVIEDAEAKGLLKKGDTVVEATSGNTCIAVAMLCAQRGYKCVITMAEPFSIERRKIMRMLGAKVKGFPLPFFSLLLLLLLLLFFSIRVVNREYTTCSRFLI